MHNPPKPTAPAWGISEKGSNMSADYGKDKGEQLPGNPTKPKGGTTKPTTASRKAAGPMKAAAAPKRK